MTQLRFFKNRTVKQPDFNEWRANDCIIQFNQIGFFSKPNDSIELVEAFPDAKDQNCITPVNVFKIIYFSILFTEYFHNCYDN